MPGTRKSNQRYRTKEELARDAAFILSASAADVAWGTKYDVLNGIMWGWTESDGKYIGCQYWSLAALEARKQNPRWIQLVVHEHIVPRKVLLSRLHKMQQPTKKTVFEFLKKFCIGVVITREEHTLLNDLRDKMPSEFDPQNPQHCDPWLWYSQRNIRWWTQPTATTARTNKLPVRIVRKECL